MADITGTPGPDRIHGTGAGEVIDGGEGDDSIWGNGGDDQLAGDLGNDRLFGNLGHDTLDGYKGLATAKAAPRPALRALVRPLARIPIASAPGPAVRHRCSSPCPCCFGWCCPLASALLVSLLSSPSVHSYSRHGQYLYLSGCGFCLEAVINETQSPGGFPCASIPANTVYGSVLLPADRNVRSSFIHA